MKDHGGRITIITGASSGIGWELAKLCAKRRDKLVLIARRVERLQELQQSLAGRFAAESLVMPMDLADADSVAEVVPQVLEAFGRLDVLVNNAGYGKQCHFEEMDDADISRMFAVNVLAPMTLAREAAVAMKRQGRGSIVNVASVGGLVAHPLNVTYCASKHALLGFSKALRLELEGTGVHVTAVCPAATRTEFFDVARGEIPFHKMIDAGAAPPEKVAKVILQASIRAGAVVFPSLGARFLFEADRWLPRASAAGNVLYRDAVLASED